MGHPFRDTESDTEVHPEVAVAETHKPPCEGVPEANDHR